MLLSLLGLEQGIYARAEKSEDFRVTSRLPEYEGEIMRALGYKELAVVLKNGKPVLVWSGDADAKVIEKQLRPLMASLPRGRQLAGVYVVSHPLPRTATGKIKRWELQKETETL